MTSLSEGDPAVSMLRGSALFEKWKKVDGHNLAMWRVAILVAVLMGSASCGDGTGLTSSSTAGAPTAPSSTIAATTTTSATTPTASDTTSSVPDVLLPDQAVLPVMLFVDGVVYDLSKVPAQEIADIGQSSLPFAGPPVLTEEGLLVATGEAYDATLILYPDDGGDPVEFARGVGSFALSQGGRRLVWAQPTPAERDGDTELVEVVFPSGQVLHTTTFSGFPSSDVDPPGGFADVVTYVGDSVLLMTGDGAVATAAVWTPATDEVTIVAGYGSSLADNTSGSHVVLSQGDGPCGVIASIGDDSSVAPRGALDCWASWAPTFSPGGAVIASAGTDGETGPPVLLLTAAEGHELARIRIVDVAGRYFQPHTIRWFDDQTLVLLASSFDSSRTDSWDEEWGIWLCDTQQSECGLAQAIAFSPTDFHQVAVVDTAFNFTTCQELEGNVPEVG